MSNGPINAQHRLFREELVRILDILGSETEVRAIILTGAGKLFPAGALGAPQPAAPMSIGRRLNDVLMGYANPAGEDNRNVAHGHCPAPTLRRLSLQKAQSHRTLLQQDQTLQT